MFVHVFITLEATVQWRLYCPTRRRFRFRTAGIVFRDMGVKGEHRKPMEWDLAECF